MARTDGSYLGDRSRMKSNHQERPVGWANSIARDKRLDRTVTI
jgi:putative protein kinase ArgK-like GTPase of G3E family